MLHSCAVSKFPICRIAISCKWSSSLGSDKSIHQQAEIDACGEELLAALSIRVVTKQYQINNVLQPTEQAVNLSNLHVVCLSIKLQYLWTLQSTLGEIEHCTDRCTRNRQTNRLSEKLVKEHKNTVTNAKTSGPNYIMSCE